MGSHLRNFPFTSPTPLNSAYPPNLGDDPQEAELDRTNSEVMSLDTGAGMTLKGKQGVKTRTKLGRRSGLRLEKMVKWGGAGRWVNDEGGDEIPIRSEVKNENSC